MTVWGRPGYLAVTGTLVLAAGAVWVRAEPHRAGPIAAGLATAWAIQAAAYWTLAGRLMQGGGALRVWAAGIAARFGGLAVVGAGAGAARWPLGTLVVAYGSAAVAGLMLEVLWLSKGGGRTPETTIDPGRE